MGIRTPGVDEQHRYVRHISRLFDDGTPGIEFSRTTVCVKGLQPERRRCELAESGGICTHELQDIEPQIGEVSVWLSAEAAVRESGALSTEDSQGQVLREVSGVVREL